jgi:hypothetical protein
MTHPNSFGDRPRLPKVVGRIQVYLVMIPKPHRMAKGQSPEDKGGLRYAACCDSERWSHDEQDDEQGFPLRSASAPCGRLWIRSGRTGSFMPRRRPGSGAEQALALEQAPHERQPIHLAGACCNHPDRGSRYVSIRHTERQRGLGRRSFASEELRDGAPTTKNGAGLPRRREERPLRKDAYFAPATARLAITVMRWAR